MLPIVKYILRQYEHCAEKREIAFLLTAEEFEKMINLPCVYCGVTGSNKAVRKQYAVKEYNYNGIDRVNSDQPYTVSNTVACCGECNAAKSNMPLAVFLNSNWLAEKVNRINELRKVGK